MKFLKKILQSTLIKGTLLLSLAGILCRCIGFLYKIFLSREIGATGLGLYQLIFPIYALCLSLTTSGFQTAISKYVSEKEASQNPGEAKLYLVCGLLCSTFGCVVVTMLLNHYREFIGLYILKEPQSISLIKTMSYSLIPAAVHSCINGYYYGKKKAAIPSASQLAEQLGRCLVIYLIFRITQQKQIPFTASHAIWGLLIGEFFALAICLPPLLFDFEHCRGNIKKATLSIIAFAIPVSANHVFMSLFSSIENLLIPQKLMLFGYQHDDALSIYGTLTGMAMPVILLPMVFTGSISVLLLPIISNAKAKGDSDTITRFIGKAVRYSLLIGFCFTFVFILCSHIIGEVLFHNVLAGVYIARLSWICPFLFLTSLLASIFHGLGNPSFPLKVNLLSCVIRILFIWFGIPNWGIYAYLFGMLISYGVSGIIYLIYTSSITQKDTRKLSSPGV